MWKIRPIRYQILQSSAYWKKFTLSSTCLFSNNIYKKVLLYLRTNAPSVSGLPLFRPFRCWYTLKRRWVYGRWEISSFCANTTITQNPKPAFLTLVHTHLTHSGEHGISWSTLQCKFTVCHLVADSVAVLLATTELFTSLSLHTHFHQCPSRCISWSVPSYVSITSDGCTKILPFIHLHG